MYIYQSFDWVCLNMGAHQQNGNMNQMKCWSINLEFFFLRTSDKHILVGGIPTPQLLLLFPIPGKVKNVPNHQPALNKFYAVSLAVWPSAVSQCLFSFPQPITSRWQQYFVPQDWQNYQTLLGWNRWYTCWKILVFSMGFSHMFPTFFYDFTSYKPSHGLPGWQRCRPRCGCGWQGLGPQALNDQWIGSFSSFVGKQTRNHGFCHKMLWNIYVFFGPKSWNQFWEESPIFVCDNFEEPLHLS